MLIPLKTLISTFNFKPKGVIHMGANYGQEAAAYQNAGVKHVWWIEAIPDVFVKMREAMGKFHFDTITCSNYCLSDVDGQEVEFKITNNEGQSSSMLDFGTHAQAHPEVRVVRKIKLKTKRFDTIVDELLGSGEYDHNAPALVNMTHYDFLNVDLQGAELLALRGMGEYLARFRYAYIEVNEKELYQGCPHVSHIDEHMGRYGFTRVETHMTNWGWGDAFYTRKK
jgi:FkbM family methyltransferase